MSQKKRVEREDEFFYTNKLNGKQLTFAASETEVVATFAPSTTTASISAVLAGTPETVGLSQPVNRVRGFAVLQKTADDALDAVGELVEAHPEALNAMPALVDPEGLTRYFLPDEFTVQFAEGVSSEAAERVIADQGATVLVRQRTPGYYTLTVPEGHGLFETIRNFAALDEVEFAEPSEAGFEDGEVVPSDPMFARLWGLRNTGQPVRNVSGTPGADIDAPLAWESTQGSRDVVVAVIDTGADVDHPDLAPNLLPRDGEDWNFATNDDDSPDDPSSHGTHVAGTVAAVGNLAGVVGVAHGAWVMPLRINLRAGMNQNRADAINYVANRARDDSARRYVVNCSWRMSGDHAGVHRAIRRAAAADVVVIFAAGNADRDIDVRPGYPAVYQEVIAVAATDQFDRRAPFSNYGRAVDVSAPGVNILSTVPGGGYDYKNGTSMAAPHVAGLAALVLSAAPKLSAAEVRQVVEGTCDNIDDANGGYVGKLGKGRVNAARAVAQAAS